MPKRVRRQTGACHAKDLYQSPTPGQVVNGSSLSLRWNPDCIRSSTIDVYLYSQHQSTSLPVHAWLTLSNAPGNKSVPLQAQWWNHTQNMAVNLQMVPGGSQPWESPYPLSLSWTLGNVGDSDMGIDASVVSSDADVTRYAAPDDLSPGKIAAAVILPILALIAVLVGGFVWQRRRQARRDAARHERYLSYSQQATTPPTVQTHTPEAPAPSFPTWDPTPVSYADAPALQPETSKEYDTSGLDSIPSSLQEPEHTSDVPPVPPASEQRHRHRHRRKKAKPSTMSSSTDQGASYGLEDPHGTLSPTRKRAEAQRYADRSPRDILDRAYGVDHDMDTSTRARAPRAELTDALGLTMSSTPVLTHVYDTGDDRNSYTYDHEERRRPVSPEALGTHSRDDKIYAYLAKLEEPDDASDTHHGLARPTSAASRLSHGSEGFQDAVAYVDET